MDKEKAYLDGWVRTILTDIKTGAQDISDWNHNTITTAGKAAILNRLKNAAAKANEGVITYGAVGTGTNTPAVSDTTLQTELARKTVSVATRNGLQLTLRVFYTTSEANGDLTEFGWFGEDASAAADSGTLFNHVLISKTKDSSKTLTIEQIIEFA